MHKEPDLGERTAGCCWREDRPRGCWAGRTLTQGQFAGSIWSLCFLLLFPHSGWNRRFIFLLLILIHKVNINNEKIHTDVRNTDWVRAQLQLKGYITKLFPLRYIARSLKGILFLFFKKIEKHLLLILHPSFLFRFLPIFSEYGTQKPEVNHKQNSFMKAQGKYRTTSFLLHFNQQVTCFQFAGWDIAGHGCCTSISKGNWKGLQGATTHSTDLMQVTVWCHFQSKTSYLSDRLKATSPS